MTKTGPNPHRVGACQECGSWRSDGRPPYLHYSGCTYEADLQIDRWLQEQQTGNHGGPTLYCADLSCPEHGARDRESQPPHS